nr:MAG TPA: hypothetical protein [Caudoviricetes sp.]
MKQNFYKYLCTYFVPLNQWLQYYSSNAITDILL